MADFFCRQLWLALILWGTFSPDLLQAQQWSPERTVVRVIGSQARRAFELSRLRLRDPWLEQAPVYQGLWLRESGAQDSSVYDLLPFASAPRGRDGVALAFDQGTGSRMWSGFTDENPTRSALLGSAARGLLELWRLLPSLNGGAQDLVRASQCPGMRVRVGAEELPGFGTDGRDTPLGTRAVILYADCQRRLGSAWHLSTGLRAYQWRTPGLADRQDLESSVRIARVETQDALVLFLDGSWTPHYQRAILHLERPFTLDRIHLRPLVRLAWGDGLPWGLGFWPGGYDGFPGLKDGEGRGDREFMAALDLKRPVFSKVWLRVLLAAGRTANGGPLLPSNRLLLGGRFGVNLQTRFGVVRLEYGRATEGHRAVFLRLGRIL